MTPIQTWIFNLFPDCDIAIVGSACYKPEPKDVDVLFISKVEFDTACEDWGLKPAGWDANYGKVYRANLTISKLPPIQLVWLGSVTSFEDHPHILFKRDGTILNPDKIYLKPESGKYEKGIRVDRRKESKLVAAIDFDGTIRDWDTSLPLPGVKDAINILREQKVKVIIHSCNDHKWIERWFNDHDIRFDSIWTGAGKPIASIYIDDRGFRLTNWNNDIESILTQIKETT